jgi:dihydrofolate reductase
MYSERLRKLALEPRSNAKDVRPRAGRTFRAMRKVIEATLISLDGVVDDVGAWGQKYFDPAWWTSYTRALEACDVLLLGRNTYEMLGERARSVDNAYTARLNGIRKYVFSSTLARADWKGSTLVRGDVAAEVARLKREPGKDIMSYGHGPLGQTLLQHDLLDEIQFWIHPVLVGRGKTALRDNLRAELELVESRTLANGVVVVTYQPSRGPR